MTTFPDGLGARAVPPLPPLPPTIGRPLKRMPGSMSDSFDELSSDAAVLSRRRHHGFLAGDAE
jgi:hypothetical protein